MLQPVDTLLWGLFTIAFPQLPNTYLLSLMLLFVCPHPILLCLSVLPVPGYLISQHLAGLVLSPTPQSWPFTAYSCANSPISPLQRGSPSHPLLHSLVCRLSSLLLSDSHLYQVSRFLNTNSSSPCPYLILIPTTFEPSRVFSRLAFVPIRGGGYCLH